MTDVEIPALAIAARRLGLDAYDLAEAMLCRLDNGEPYWRALHSVVAEAAQRRGIYDGETKARIDSGDIFTVRPAPMPGTPGRMLEAVADGRADIFDMLAAAGAMNAMPCHAKEEVERRKAVRLAENGED